MVSKLKTPRLKSGSIPFVVFELNAVTVASRPVGSMFRAIARSWSVFEVKM